MASKHLIDRGRAIVERLGITLQDHLGTGGFGAVYSALSSDGTKLAVKFCEKTQFTAYLEREAQIQLQFNHENLVRLYNFMVCWHSHHTNKQQVTNHQTNKQPQQKSQISQLGCAGLISFVFIYNKHETVWMYGDVITG